MAKTVRLGAGEDFSAGRDAESANRNL